MKPNFFIIPLVALAVSVGGSWAVNAGLQWYNALQLPEWTPSGAFIGSVWTVLYVLAVVSALVAYNRATPQRAKIVAGVFAANAVLNVAWSAIFFGMRQIGWAMIDAVLLGMSVMVAMAVVKRISPFSAWLLVPYLAWTGFAAYLNGMIWVLNR